MASGYKITATIIKPRGMPVLWTRFTRRRMTKSQCEKMFSVPDDTQVFCRKTGYYSCEGNLWIIFQDEN
ncbi:DUF1187 family protein [Salmonella enterica subsp. enterica serovar Weybridge]|nr:DUF1187 family protein [Salmonella enterica subsp. enterica serovar Weybridge]